MMRRLIWIVVLLALPPLAAAFDEPTGFNDVPFGASAHEIGEKTRSQVVCGPATAEQQRSFDTACRTTADIASVPVTVQFWLVSDRLGSVEIGFRSSDYAVIHDAFIRRYGPATYRLEELVTDRAGSKLESEVLRWDGRTTTVMLRQYDLDTDAGSASLRTNEYSRLLEKRRIRGATR
jgi:hypothetical protein